MLTVNVPLVHDSVTNTNNVGGTVTLPASVDKNVPKTYYVGMPYKLTATPKPGFVFYYWSVSSFNGTGVTLSATELPSLTFIMQPGLTVSALFTKSFFTADVIGTYSGLVLPSSSLPSPAGTLPNNANTGAPAACAGSAR